MPSEILFVARRNRKNRFYLHSKENYFGDIKFEYVMIDTGCNSFLLPLKEGQIIEIARKYNKNNSIWSFVTSRNVNSDSIVLNIESKDLLAKFYIEDQEDNKIYSKIAITKLRFHLCKDDIIEIKNLFDIRSIVLTNHNIDHNNIKTTRRKHALLGQSIIKDRHLLIQYENLCLLINTSDNNNVWNRIEDIIIKYNIVSGKSKEDSFEYKEFDALEDEDHDIDDKDTYAISDEDLSEN
jgi:hypothetical protein